MSAVTHANLLVRKIPQSLPLVALLCLALPMNAQAGRAYVSDEDDNAVSVIDTDTQKVISTIDVGKRPRGLKLSPDDSLLYVAVSGLPKCGPREPEEECEKRKHDLAADGIAVVDTAKLKLVKALKAGTDPEQFDISPDGKRLFISNEDAASVSVVDLATGKISAKIPVGKEPEGARVSPDGRIVIVTSESGNSVAVIDSHTLKVLRTVEVGKRPRDVAFTPDGKVIYVTGESDSSLSKVVLAGAEPAQHILNFRPEEHPMGVILDSRRHVLYVSTGRGGTVVVVSPDESKVVADVPVGPRPWGIALSSDGRYLYTANGPSNDVSIVDTSSMKVVDKVSVGHSPWGIVVSH